MMGDVRLTFPVVTAVLVLLLLPAIRPAVAQDPIPPVMTIPEIVAPPAMASPGGVPCFTLVNKAPYSVFVTINNNYSDTGSGKARASRNFRLQPGQSDGACTAGPFYPGGRVELVIRSLVPLFSCYTAAQGETIIYGEHRPEGGTRSWADCR